MKRPQLGSQLLNKRFILLVGVLHQHRRRKVCFALFFSLKPSIRNFADFSRVKLRPIFSMVVKMKFREALQIDKIDKCISLIAIVFHVDGQIKKIVFALEIFVNFFNEQFLSKFVWNILNHNGRLFFFENFISHYIILFLIRNWKRIFFIFFRLFLFFTFLFFNRIERRSLCPNMRDISLSNSIVK